MVKESLLCGACGAGSPVPQLRVSLHRSWLGNPSTSLYLPLLWVLPEGQGIHLVPAGAE